MIYLSKKISRKKLKFYLEINSVYKSSTSLSKNYNVFNYTEYYQ